MPHPSSAAAMTAGTPRSTGAPAAGPPASSPGAAPATPPATPSAASPASPAAPAARVDALASSLRLASSVDDLAPLAAAVDDLVGQMFDAGADVTRIAQTAGQLNRQLFARAWALIAPPELFAGSCLVVMGSEGRGEQLLKTDQDNALILRDGVDPASACPAATRFNQALATFGYPQCPGNIMLTHPHWCRTASGFRALIRQWIYTGERNGPMHLAIFMDAAPVAGDVGLLDSVRHFLESIISDHDGFLARFAAAADQFGDDAPWWQWLSHRRDAKTLDIKKRGTFPLVHGARALAVQYRISQPGTIARFEALDRGGHLPDGMAPALIETLRTLMTLRLAQQLRARAAGQPPDNLVRPEALDDTQRRQLHDALAVVKDFRLFLRQHFRLDRFG